MSALSADLNKREMGMRAHFTNIFCLKRLNAKTRKYKRYKYSQISSNKGTLTKFNLQGSQRTNADKPNNRTPIILNIYN